MKTPRSLLTTIVITVLLAVVFAFNMWLLAYAQLSPTQFTMVFMIELALLISAVWIGYALIHARLLAPLRTLEDQLKLLSRVDANHEFDLPAQHYLDTLPETAAEFGHALARERNQTARAIESAAALIERRKARLEAILHDLSEGVIVCSTDHQIVLFNHVAGMLLRDMGTLSLHRSISSFFGEDLIERTFESLRDVYSTQSRREVVQLDCEPQQLRLRMALVVEPDHSLSGYVLSLSSRLETPDDAPHRYEQSVITDRPEFYDFALFERAIPSALSDRPLHELTYVVFDTETTGLRPSRGDAIVQISAVRIVNQRILETEQFDCLVNPGFPIPRSSIRFHGITDDMVVGAADVGAALRRFHAFADDAVLVAHNAAFDMKFIKLGQDKAGVRFNHAVLDTLLLSFVLQPNHSAHTLDAIAARYGVEIPPGARHTAIGDARCTAGIFQGMLSILPAQGIKTLQQAIDASSRVFEVRKLQEQF